MQCELIHEICGDCQNKTCVPQTTEEISDYVMEELSSAIAIIIDIANNKYLNLDSDTRRMLTNSIIEMQHARSHMVWNQCLINA